MASNIFSKLDTFLSQNDHESMSWCDGMEHETAENYLNEFEEDDWLLLKDCWKNRNIQWQGCLISVLHPSSGLIAEQIMIQMAMNYDPDIAFEAMSRISFYCGVNANSKGVFIDNSIVQTEFRNRLKTNKKFIASIPVIATLIGRKYEFLQQLLKST